MIVEIVLDHPTDTCSLPRGYVLYMNSANGRGIEMNDNSEEAGLERE
jgi:hypothetical protein